MPTPKYLEMLHKREKISLLRNMAPAWIWRWLQYRGYRKRFPHAFVSSESDVSPNARLGKGAMIDNAYIGGAVEVGEFTAIGNRCRIGGEASVRIGSFCSIAPGCFIFSTNHNHKSKAVYPLSIIYEGKTRQLPPDCYSIPICIGNDVWLGQESKILAGANISDGCIVGAGSVVPKGEYPPYSILGGVPAKVVGQRFSDEAIADILALKWWAKGEEVFHEETIALLLSPADPPMPKSADNKT